MIKEGSKVELIADTFLDGGDYGYKRIIVSPDEPCKGIVRSIRMKKCKKSKSLMVSFSPEQYPDEIFEFSIKKFREIKNGWTS